jgi:thiol:disulfide interchange protein
MKTHTTKKVCALIGLLLVGLSQAQDFSLNSTSTHEQPPEGWTEILKLEPDFSWARVHPAKQGNQSGLVVQFQGTEGIHYYAQQRPNGYDFDVSPLTVSATSERVTLGSAALPVPHTYRDTNFETDIDIYSGDFEVFVPFTESPPAGSLNVTVTISGQGCTDTGCTPPKTANIELTFDPSTTPWASLPPPPDAPAHAKPVSETTKQEPPPSPSPATQNLLTDSSPGTYGTAIYLLLAILAGLSINLMPCVLPIIPIVVMRLLEHSQSSAHQRIKQGLAFCGGIMLFFLAFAVLAAVINLTTGAVLDLNSLFRYPTVSITLFLVIVLFGLAMLDIIPIVLPSAVANRSGTGTGLSASLGTGFFAAVLSIPCSGALLGFVLVWAQTQPLAISSLTIVVMGLGMALPYALVISIPGLLDKMPKPGTWMELFKKSCGFLLFFVGVKLGLAALPKERLLNVLMYGVIFSFCAWMWGKWVDFSTPAKKKQLIRGIALGIAMISALWLLPARTAPEGVTWQSYSDSAVDQAKSKDQIVLLKFTADWCTNCKVVEKRVFHNQEVIDALSANNVLAIKADTTTQDMPATKALKDRFGEAGNVPVTILLIPGQEPIKLRGIYQVAELLGHLN